MTTQEIEDIKSVAVFMNLRPIDNDKIKPPGGTDYVHISELQYSTSWDCLMPVVEKIESLNFSSEAVFLTSNGYRLQFFSGGASMNSDKLHVTKKEATYKAVVEFIKWYNEQ